MGGQKYENYLLKQWRPSAALRPAAETSPQILFSSSAHIYCPRKCSGDPQHELRGVFQVVLVCPGVQE